MYAGAASTRLNPVDLEIAFSKCWLNFITMMRSLCPRQERDEANILKILHDEKAWHHQLMSVSAGEYRGDVVAHFGTFVQASTAFYPGEVPPERLGPLPVAILARLQLFNFIKQAQRFYPGEVPPEHPESRSCGGNLSQSPFLLACS